MSANSASQLWQRSSLLRTWLAPIAAMLILSLYCLDVSNWFSAEITEGLWARVSSFFSSFTQLNTSAEYQLDCLSLSAQTFAIASLGMLGGVLGALILALGASEALVQSIDNSISPISRKLRFAFRESSRLLLDIARGVPDFVWAMLIMLGPGPGPITGIFAIAISVSGILGKIFSELWDSVSPEQCEAMKSQGCTRFALLTYVLIPSSSRSMISYTLMRAECAMRNSSVIGIVGGGGLGGQIFEEFGYGAYGNVCTLLLYLLALTLSADLFANWIRMQMRGGTTSVSATSWLQASRKRLAAIFWLSVALAFSIYWLSKVGAFARASSEMGRVEWPYIQKIVGSLLAIDFSLGTWTEAISGCVLPLSMAFIATFFGALWAAVSSFYGSSLLQKNIHIRIDEGFHPLKLIGSVFVRGCALILRAVPEAAWLLIFAVIFQLSLFAGVLAVFCHSAGVLSRVFIETVDDLESAWLEGMSLGGKCEFFYYVIIPHAWRGWLTYSVFHYESSVRSGLVLGILGVGGIGDSFHSSWESFDYSQAGTFLLVMILLTTIIDRIFRWVKITRSA